MAGIGVAVEQLDGRVGPLEDGLVDLPAGPHRAHGHGGIGDALGHADQVRRHPEPLRREGRAQASEAGDHLVEDQQDVVLVAERPQPLQIALGRRQHTCGPGHGLDDHRGDGGCVVQADQPLQPVGQVRPMLRLAVGEGVAGQVMGVRQVIHLGQLVVEIHAVLRQAADGDAAEIDPVIAPLPPDQPGLVPLPPGPLIGERDLQGRLHGLRSGIGEEHMVEPLGHQVGDPGGQLEGQGVGQVEGGGEVQDRRLLLDRLDDPRAAVARIHAPQARRAVQHLAPLRRLEMHVLGAGQHPRIGLEAAIGGERDPEGGQVVGQGRVHGSGSGRGRGSFRPATPVRQSEITISGAESASPAASAARVLRTMSGWRAITRR